MYTLEDGSKVFSRSNGTSQKSKADGGGEVLKFSYVENFVGGTGQFKAIRGQITGGGERDLVAKSVKQQSMKGEYWIEE